MLKLKSLAIILIYQQILIPCWTKVDITPLIILIYQIKTTKTLFFDRLKNKLLNLHAIKLNCMQSNDSKISAEGLTYDDVRERYEHFRARCGKKNKKKTKFIKSMKLNKTKKKHKGCTEPIHKVKSKGVVNIVPVNTKCDSISVDAKCFDVNL